MLADTVINQFIVKLRLQAVLEGIDEKVALGYASARLRLATGEISKNDYHSLIDEINRIFCLSASSDTDQASHLNHWIEQQIVDLRIAQLS
ncbi:hypothetical protein cce_3424 [Crocosphaera subtropica ATCC 51142]|uniref:Uncharacterized protein n=1 Tax=Crocosphaera subtropica (strain ATCC 51142 / BH68) TaxID=43989 RepID=B1WZ08_CROS5|nr:hypothetical protein [Crocosphaera subtropica]ACB52772.1 hypothetical protein cce_3424 [Crocosphaera subtropica ATCC 51142]